MWISFDLHALPASVSLPALAPRPLRRFIATMRVLTPRRLLQPRRGIPASRKHTSGHSVANHLMQHCHSFQVPFLHLAISACVSPHEYGLHPTLAGSPRASSRIAFVSYGLSFPLPLLPTPPRGDAVTIGCLERASPEGDFRPQSTPARRRTHSREGDRVVSIYNIRVGATAIHQMPKGELVDCQIQPPAGEEKSARCLRRSEAVVCHTILVAAYPFS